ncbi:MAG TPA: HesA/MoeB/ThiF family protein, partial [Candidatus Limnocylindria bacterium]|nr:HesA/MoeB/ThiF family protein [Candidatus Limnocylindria bacterium]
RLSPPTSASHLKCKSSVYILFMKNSNRYSRQTILPEIGETGQERIGAAHVLIVGAGGLGCPSLLYLTAAGVGAIGIIDDDNVDVSNLQRQVLFDTKDAGRSKAKAAKKHLEIRNPDISITCFPERLDVSNALQIMGGYDVIVDGTDNFAAKFLINDAAVKLGKPVVYGSILGFEGHASVFWAKEGPCYRCLYPAPPAGYVPNCAEAGVIGALAGIVGSVQSMEVIKLLTGGEALRPLIGKLWVTDARTMQTSNFAIPKNPACPVCSRHPEDIILKDEPQLCVAAMREVSIKDVGDHALFIDVREKDEWDAGHIEGAVHLPLSALMAGKKAELMKANAYVVYCAKGARSLKAIEILEAQGIHGALNLKGGYDGLRKS